MNLDKFYTKQFIADYYSSVVYERYKNQEYIEPCAGNGAFLRVLPNIKGYDILPERADIIQQDVFKSTYTKDQVVVTNPPFGKNSSMAVKVFNHIASYGVKAICVIVPKTFKKVSIQNKLNLNYHIVFEQDIISNAYTENGIDIDVPTVFQIWEKSKKPRKITEIQTTSEYFDFVEKGNHDIAVRRVGGKAGQVVKDGSESSTYFLKIYEYKVKVALRLFDYNSVVNDTAGVKSISKHELIVGLHNIIKELV